MTARYITVRDRRMTTEAARLLTAAAGDSDPVRTNQAGRWIIVGAQRRPDRRTRESLVKNGYLTLHCAARYTALRITTKGREALTSFTITNTETVT